MNYVALATIIALILDNTENHETKFRCSVPGEQPQIYLAAVINKTAANRVLKSVIDRFAAMQIGALTGVVYDRGKWFQYILSKYNISCEYFIYLYIFVYFNGI